MTSSKFPLRFFWPALSLGLILLTAYANSFQGPFIFDDVQSIADNETLHSLATAFFPPHASGVTVSGRPVLNLSFALNRMIFGESVVGYHVVNWLVHFFAALILFGLVKHSLLLPALRKRFGDVAGLVAWTVALIWAVHPLQTESVTYMVQRAESLCGLFYLFTMYAFVRSLEHPDALLRWQFASVISCLFGMGTKEVMVSAPIIVLLFDRTLVSGSFRIALSSRRYYYAGLAATWGLLGICMASSLDRGATVGFSAGMAWGQYLLTQCHALLWYLWLTIWPASLTFDYGQLLVSATPVVFVEASVLVLFFVAICFTVVRKSKFGLLGAMYFAVLMPTTLVPVVTQTLAEHRMYLALAPLALLAVLITERWLGRRFVVIWLVVVVVLVRTTFVRNNDYNSIESIWTDSGKKNPGNYHAWSSLGHVYLSQGRITESKEMFLRARSLGPEDPDVLRGLGSVYATMGEWVDAKKCFLKALDLLTAFPPEALATFKTRHDLGVVLSRGGFHAEAVVQFTEALAYYPKKADTRAALAGSLAALDRREEALVQFKNALRDDPKCIRARAGLGDLLIRGGQIDEGLSVIAEGVKLVPEAVDLRYSYGVALLGAGRVSESILEFEDCVRTRPNWGEPHGSLGLALEVSKRFDEACKHLAMAEQAGVKTDLLYLTWGSALRHLGHFDEALLRYQQAARMAPQDVQIRYSVANLLLQLGRLEQAITQYEGILVDAPGFVDAHNELGVAYAESGNPDAARREFEGVLRLRPADEGARDNLRRLGQHK